MKSYKNIKSCNFFISDFYREEHLEYIDENWNKVIPYILHYNEVVPQDRLDIVSEKIKQKYLNGQKLSKKTHNLLIKVTLIIQLDLNSINK